MKVRLLTLLSLAVLTSSCTKEVQPRPVADFTYTTSAVSNTETVVYFTNTSKNANRYQWIGSGGTATTDQHISLHYTSNGRYTVSLTAKNDVGEDTKTQNIDISGLATTGSHVFYTGVGDKGDISVYVNNTLQGKINKYYSSGSPSCGEQGSVTVTLAPGTYSYSATTGGLIPYQWSGTFTVIRGQCNSIRLAK